MTPPRDYDSTGMVEGSPFANRARSNNLRQQEQAMHDDLMETESRYWPESLKEFVDLRQKAVGLCGDVISTAVADWIANRRTEPKEPKA